MKKSGKRKLANLFVFFVRAEALRRPFTVPAVLRLVVLFRTAIIQISNFKFRTG